MRSVSSLQGLEQPWSLLAERVDGFDVQGLLFGAVFALLVMNQLPKWYHPVFNWERFSRVSDDGFFLAPTLIDGVEPGMKAYEDEIFGPVLSVTRVSTYDEAVRLPGDIGGGL